MKKIIDNIFYCGSQHRDRRLFDQLVPLPEGTTYNSYLIKGSEKTALLDTVYPEKAGELLKALEDFGVNQIDYIICHHAEQDHSGSLPEILEKYPQAIILTNPKCKNSFRNDSR
jgi:flavorubredoxin